MGFYPASEDPIEVFNQLTGYKASSDELDPSITGQKKWNGPYLEAETKNFEFGQKNRAYLDPWKKPYNFRFKNPKKYGKCDVWSNGPNMINDNGTGDDIHNG